MHHSYSVPTLYLVVCCVLQLITINHQPVLCSGAVVMSVGQYPARIYQNAPPGVPVVKVSAYDNNTGYLTNFRLENTDDARHFQIGVDGVIRTASIINYVVGRTFEFFVYALYNQKSCPDFDCPYDLADYKHVKIIVSERNKFSPTFSNTTYLFPVYRFGIGDVIGQVTAMDNDPESYNSKVTIYTDGRQVALNYLEIDKKGTITLKHAVPESTDMLDLKVMAVDTGSPPKTGSATVIIDVIMVRQPKVFCLSATETSTTLCWKNPMPERVFNGYTVKVSGDIKREDFLPLISGHAEACYTLNGTQVGNRYAFRVTVNSRDYWYGDTMDVAFNKTGTGVSPECAREKFSTCGYLAPCKNGGTCMPGAGSSSPPSDTSQEGGEGGDQAAPDYSCICQDGWMGDNCTVKDACTTSPCGDNGRCVLDAGHGTFRCECHDGYFGNTCEHFNMCLRAPCMNGGSCEVHENGTYFCSCPPGFSGQDCQDRDPCTPNPCVNGQGHCARISDTVQQCQCNTGYYGERCEIKDVCVLTQPCLYDGKCINTDESFKCECQAGRMGDRCEVNNPCSIQPCRNGAPCSIAPSGSYSCECLPGYHGSECQNLDLCHGVDCHNGTCTSTEGQEGRCQCESGFHGEYCTDFDVCLNFDNPCSGRGTCVSNTGSQDGGGSNPNMRTEFICECQPGHLGRYCQETNHCFPKDCKHGARCVEVGINQYDCMCPDGRYQEDCSNQDPCHNHKCLNGGQCNPINDTAYECVCPDKYVGDMCGHLDLCADDLNPCKNNGKCVMNYGTSDDNPVECVCPRAFTGEWCQWPNSCWNSPCIHGTCVIRDDIEGAKSTSDLFHCQCSSGFTGTLCDIFELQPCIDAMCRNGGTCDNESCVCQDGFTGPYCDDVIVECVEDFSLPDPKCQCKDGRILCGQDFECGPDELQLSSREGHQYCVNISHVTIDHDTVLRCCRDTGCEIYSPTCDSRTHCTEGTVPDTTCQYFQCVGVACSQELSLSCLDLARPGDRGWIQCATDKLTAIQIADPTKLGASEVANVANEVIQQIDAAVEKREVAQLAMDIINSLSDVNTSVSRQVEKQNKTNTRLRHFLDQYTAQVGLGDGSVTMATDGFVVLATNVSAFQNGTIQFEPEIENSMAMNGISITIPSSVLDPSNKEYDITEDSRLQFIAYRKSQLFTPKFDNDDIITVDDDVISKQRVISATITGVALRDLKEKVRIVLPGLKKGVNHTCVFWDESSSGWSEEGVTTVYDEKTGMFTCLSSHLTSFAVLISPTPAALKSQIGLSYITYIGSGISVACLILTIITYGLFRCLHGEKSGKILLHLCVSLLFLNVVFLMGSVDVSDFSDDACKAVALLLHYFLLSTLFWMLVEAVEMYRAIVTVFTKYERHHLVKRCLVGWGIPAVIVIVTASIDIDHYGSNVVDGDGNDEVKICFMTPTGGNIAYYAALLTPACLIVLINTIVFILVVRVILKPRFQQQVSSNTAPFTPAQVRGAFTVMFLLGVTWIFGPLAIGEAQIVFSYIFCISNSLQGFLIFIFRCLFNPEARLAWSQLYHTGTLKRRRGPIKSMYVDSSSSKEGHDASSSTGTRRLSNSTNVNLTTSTNFNNSMKLPLYRGNGGIHAHPHQLHTTNGWHPNLNGMKRDNGYNGDGYGNVSSGGSGNVSLGGSVGSAGDEGMMGKTMAIESVHSSRTGSQESKSKLCDFSSISKHESPPADPYNNFQDELTHL